jgi:putative endonuclease
MGKPWYVYLLLCDEKTFYVGITTDLKNRLYFHKTKQSFFTKKFSQIKIVYCEKYPDETSAVKREKQLKGWSRAKKQMLVNGKLGYNTCTEIAEDLSCSDEKPVSLP